MPSEVMCMALGNVAVGEQRSWFLAVGLQDNTVRIISLDPSDCLAPRSMQALPAAAESLCIVEMGVKDADNSEDSAPQQSSLYLNIGESRASLTREKERDERVSSSALDGARKSSAAIVHVPLSSFQVCKTVYYSGLCWIRFPATSRTREHVTWVLGR